MGLPIATIPLSALSQLVPNAAEPKSELASSVGKGKVTRWDNEAQFDLVAETKMKKMKMKH